MSGLILRVCAFKKRAIEIHSIVMFAVMMIAAMIVMNDVNANMLSIPCMLSAYKFSIWGYSVGGCVRQMRRCLG